MNERSRQPRELILAFFGDYVLDQDVPPLRTSVLLEVLEGAGVAVPAARATLDRLVVRGILARARHGREITFSLTDDGATVLREATDRVRGLHPFDPHGSGWTLVTFTISEDQRTLRHRLRSALTWEGFAPLRDGLWIAPGEVDLDVTLEHLRSDLPTAAVTAFRAQELTGYSMDASVAAAWNIERIRAEHLAFIDTWGDSEAATRAGSPLTARAMLVADWLALLSADPRLPREYLGEDWPADRSFEVYQQWRSRLEGASRQQFESLVGLPSVTR